MRPLPQGWYPNEENWAYLTEEFGWIVDLDLALVKFRAYHAEGQTSRDWDARFVVWVVSDVQRIRALGVDKITDELGVPRQRFSELNGPQPGDPDYVSIEDLHSTAVENAQQEEQP